jgi:hypothetical protein
MEFVIPEELAMFWYEDSGAESQRSTLMISTSESLSSKTMTGT